MFLIGTIAQLPIGLLFGYLSDTRKVWVLLSLCNLFILSFGGVLLYFLERTDIWFMVGFIGLYALHFTIYMLVSIVLLIQVEFNNTEQDSQG